MGQRSELGLTVLSWSWKKHINLTYPFLLVMNELLSQKKMSNLQEVMNWLLMSKMWSRLGQVLPNMNLDNLGKNGLIIQ